MELVMDVRRLHTFIIFALAVSVCFHKGVVGDSDDIVSALDDVEDEVEDVVYKLDDQTEIIAHKMDVLTGTIEEHMDEMAGKIGEVAHKLDEQTNRLDTLIGQGRQREHTADRTLDDQDNQGHYVPAIELLSVERDPTSEDGGCRFTFRFRKNSDNIRLLLYGGGLPAKAPDSYVDEGEGVWAASFNYDCRNGNPWVMMGDQDDYMLGMSLKVNEPGRSLKQENISVPEVLVSPERELVYQPGHDVTVMVTSPSEGRENYTDVGVHISGVNLKTWKYFSSTDIPDSVLMRKGQGVLSADGMEVPVTILTSANNISGFLSVQKRMGADISRNYSPMELLTVTRMIHLKPANQDGPIPDGFLDFVDSENQHGEIRCSVGEECRLDCLAIGDSISSISVRYKDSTPVLTATRPPLSNDYIRSIYWTFTPEENYGDSNVVTTFRCLAVDAQHQAMASKYVNVLTV